MKKIFYNIIKYPLILIFIKTPLIKILKKRFKNYRFRKKRNIIWLLLDTIFQREYFNKLKDRYEIRDLVNSTFEDGNGRKWAEIYYKNHFLTLAELRKRKTGMISKNVAVPLYEKIIDFIKSKNLFDNKDTYIIQLGSLSGRDIEFFLKLFPKINYISTDINNEILDFQKEKYNYSNLKYFKCYAENIDECIDHFKISDKNLIIFSRGSLQYVNPFFLEEFFLKIKNYKNLNLFISEPVNLLFIDNNKLISDNRAIISFSHRYDEYAKNSNLNIIESQVIRPYSTDDKQFGQTGHLDLQVST